MNHLLYQIRHTGLFHHHGHLHHHPTHAPHALYFITSLVVALVAAGIIVVTVFLGVCYLTGNY